MAMAVAMGGRGGGVPCWRGGETARQPGQLAGPGARGGGPRARAEQPRGGRAAAAGRRKAATRVPDDDSAQAQGKTGRGDRVGYGEAHGYL